MSPCLTVDILDNTYTLNATGDVKLCVYMYAQKDPVTLGALSGRGREGGREGERE